MTNLLSETSTSFKSELQQKQSLIDQTHLKLREATSSLADERRRLESLQQRANVRQDLRAKIENLRRANAQCRNESAKSMNGGPVEAALKSDIAVGEADAGLLVDASLLPTSTQNMTPQQAEYLASLPPPAVLAARLKAYQRTNARLEAQAKNLQSKSSGLETQMKRVVGLCTGVEEGKVDEMLEGLKAAVESERGEEVEVGRVREFLRKVEEGGD